MHPTSRLREGDAAACCRLIAVRALPGMRLSGRTVWRWLRALMSRIASIGCSARTERTPIHANSSVTPASAAMVMSQARASARAWNVKPACSAISEPIAGVASVDRASPITVAPTHTSRYGAIIAREIIVPV